VQVKKKYISATEREEVIKNSKKDVDKRGLWWYSIEAV